MRRHWIESFFYRYARHDQSRFLQIDVGFVLIRLISLNPKLAIFEHSWYKSSVESYGVFSFVGDPL